MQSRALDAKNRPWTIFALLGRPGLAPRAIDDVVVCIVAEPPERDFRVDRLGLGRDHAGDLAVFQAGENLGVGVARIRGDGADGGSGDRRDRVEAAL